MLYLKRLIRKSDALRLTTCAIPANTAISAIQGADQKFKPENLISDAGNASAYYGCISDDLTHVVEAYMYHIPMNGFEGTRCAVVSVSLDENGKLGSDVQVMTKDVDGGRDIPAIFSAGINIGGSSLTFNNNYRDFNQAKSEQDNTNKAASK